MAAEPPVPDPRVIAAFLDDVDLEHREAEPRGAYSAPEASHSYSMTRRMRVR
jgi:hypothetical protein